MEQDVVFLTGFGPFGVHNVNASWEAVKLLTDELVGGCRVKTAEIPVVYTYVEENIRRIWDEHKPKLVVHVGVSQFADRLLLEERAFRTGYLRADCQGNCCESSEFCSPAGDCIETRLDLLELCEFVRTTNQRVDVAISKNAGRYLCEYTYYASLSVDDARTLFVHVPPLGKPYSAPEIADGIRLVVEGALKQLDEANKRS